MNDLMLGSAVDKWKEGGISNWDYLKTLNKVAGRSYSDLMQYPIMPFILADYKNDAIDLKDEKIYRYVQKFQLLHILCFIPNFFKNSSLPKLCQISVLVFWL